MKILFLKDATGHRRYVVLDVKSLDFDVMRTYDKRKIWSQATAMFKAGFQFWLSQEENAELSNSNKRYEVVTPESELLTARFKPADRLILPTGLILREFCNSLIFNDQRSLNMKNALKENGFEDLYLLD